MAATKIPEVFKGKTFKLGADEVVMVEQNYANNGRLRIQFITTGDLPEPYATLTMNLDDDPGRDAFFVKTYYENAPMLPVLLASGVFIDVKYPRDVAWKFASGRTVKFENGEVFEHQLVRWVTGTSPGVTEGLARNVPLHVSAWTEPSPSITLGRRLLEAPICSYCGKASEHVDGTAIYPHRPDLARKKFWLCRPCNAYVGCHPGTPEPLGSLANAELRKARSEAHDAFDELWDFGDPDPNGNVMTRKEAYAWLAAELGIEAAACHIALFDLEMCKKVLQAVQNRTKSAQY
jgi:hypothetical protein